MNPGVQALIRRCGCSRARAIVEQGLGEAVGASVTEPGGREAPTAFGDVEALGHDRLDVVPGDRGVDEGSLSGGATARDEVGAGSGGHVHDAPADRIDQWNEGVEDALRSAGVHVEDGPHVGGPESDARVVDQTVQGRRTGAEARRHVRGGGRHGGAIGHVDLDDLQPVGPRGVLGDELSARGGTPTRITRAEQHERIAVGREYRGHGRAADALVGAGDQHADGTGRPEPGLGAGVRSATGLGQEIFSAQRLQYPAGLIGPLTTVQPPHWPSGAVV